MSDVSNEDKILYSEIQKPPASLRFIVILVAFPVLAATIKHVVYNENFGNYPEKDYFLLFFGLIVGLIMPLYYLRSIYTIMLIDEAIIVKSWPFFRIPRKIPLNNIYKYRVVTYMAVGFLSRVRGIRIYSGFGSSGVQLEYPNRNLIYVGSQKPQKLVEAIDIALNKDVGKYVTVNLDRIQPSQPYISSEELANFIKNVERPYIDYIGEIPVREIDGQIVYIDDHTKAFAAYFLGLTEVRVRWIDDNEANDVEFRKRVRLSRKEGIHSISDLRRRIVSTGDFKKLWLDKINSG